MRNLILACLFILPVLAQAHETETHYDRINLSASAQSRLANDTLVASLYAEEEGSNAAQLADIVNKKIQWAITTLKQHPQIKLQTSAYTTNPVYQKNKIVSWRVRQTLQLESLDMAKVSELLGQLQSRLALQGMHFTVSPQLKNTTDDALISEALAAFEARAQLVTQQLKRKGYKIVDLNIATSGSPGGYQRYGMRAMALESVAAPAIESGEQDVQVTVSGSIELE
ncbi:MAG: SIMPL domain-containing protein [Gammaproteobacteria bacterium]